MAYLSQRQGEMLDESHTILEEFLALGFKNADEVLSHVINYGFEEERLYLVEKRISFN